MNKEKFNFLEIVLKVSERCNINCDYCYMYNCGNELSINSRPLIKDETVYNLKKLLENAASEFEIGTIQVDFHGGEPLMLGKRKFSEACDILLSGHYHNSYFILSCQTNGTLIDEEWVDIFYKYNVRVGISIDGPKHINDKHRLDHKGKSTYERTVNGIKMINSAWKKGMMTNEPSILCVINPKVSGKEIYRHFVDDLECKSFDLLIPDENHDTCENTKAVGLYLNEAVDEFFNDSNKEIEVRIIATHMKSLMLKEFTPVIGISKGDINSAVFVITSEGDIYIDDALRVTNDILFSPIGNLSNVKFKNLLESWQLKQYMNINNTLPSSCYDCIWKNSCFGGRALNRFSKVNRFDNKTVFCDSMRIFLSRLTSHIIESGVDIKLIEENLGVNEL
ncbi:XyeB family radical SAM/SPASM peptide maturase [Salmonella enterica subsp. enterica]|nr:XyeB family radical SAM/SPASM peptide maturase [Salmonella enterica subsp. enterica]EDY2803431.1 XyeB family radical SAM/SPASM peptide maturase [Salmonella enterica subsp. enterica]